MAKRRKKRVADVDWLQEATQRVGAELEMENVGFIEILLPIIIQIISQCIENRSPRRIEKLAKRGRPETIEALSYYQLKKFYRSEPNLSMEDFREDGRSIARAIAKTARASQAGEIESLCNSC